MPARNVIKYYVENGFYHIYNRGFEKRKIFLDNEDYDVFTFFLQRSLDQDLKVSPDGLINTHNIAEELDLLCYCLMPNHFHLLIKQYTKDAVTKLLRRVLASYVMYFNKKYDRDGGLFQGKPRAVLVKDEGYLLHLTRYIHLNPLELDKVEKAEDYKYSSYKDYLGLQNRGWTKPKEILSFFKTKRASFLKDFLSYQGFVENYMKDSKELLGTLVLE